MQGRVSNTAMRLRLRAAAMPGASTEHDARASLSMDWDVVANLQCLSHGGVEVPERAQPRRKSRSAQRLQSAAAAPCWPWAAGQPASSQSAQPRLHSSDTACPMGSWAACITSEHSDYAGLGRLGSLHQTQHSDWSAQSPACVCASSVGITEPASIDLIRGPLQRVERWAVRQLSTPHQAVMASAAGQLEM